MNSMRIGIFFGGSSREREVSFAGGRTVYDNLDKTYFKAVPIFVDSFNNFILLDWKFIYKGSIRDFYPPVKHLKASKTGVQVYAESMAEAESDHGRKIASSLGRIIEPRDLSKYIDFAFLALHGMFGEDGTIQGLLEWLGIPYSGSGILPSALGMQKRLQKQLMEKGGFNCPAHTVITREAWMSTNREGVQKRVLKLMKAPFVVKPASQGSSVGVSVIDEKNKGNFNEAVNRAFFIHEIRADEWNSLPAEEKLRQFARLCDIRDGLGLPVLCEGEKIADPDILFSAIQKKLRKSPSITLEAWSGETEVLLESFIDGREFSCIVLRNEDGSAVALPPTEIVKGKEVYDYRSKYLPGLSRKITPIDLPEKDIQRIRQECVRLFGYFSFHVYARIDGFIDRNGRIFLNDPNTTSGMMPSSFFFHQAAEIGLNPSQFLTYIIRTSLAERARTLPVLFPPTLLLNKLDEKIRRSTSAQLKKKRVAVLMGGYSTERHISVESGRNIFEKLSSSEEFSPFPVFVTGNNEKHELYRIPVNVMLKDNADDIREKVLHYRQPAILSKIIEDCRMIIGKYASRNALQKPRKLSYDELAKEADAVFIALHGRPGEDGQVQAELNRLHIPFNGSDVTSSRITINKYDTNELLRKHGFLVADHMLVYSDAWKKEKDAVIKRIEKIGYPLIAKPADDGCSSAVKKIRKREDLLLYAEGVFRRNEEINESLATRLGLKRNEEFPRKDFFLVEKFVEKGKAVHFLEVTGGMLTHHVKGKIIYEVFEPSETLSEGDVLSLEEKFLAGQGQNITPARFAKSPAEQKRISSMVRKELEKAARVLKVEGYCRIDAFVRVFRNGKVEVIFIEVNSLPGMTPATCIFHQSAINDYKPFEFVDSILKYGEERVKRAGVKS
jgi:D-alanine-D-alanine ligase